MKQLLYESEFPEILRDMDHIDVKTADSAKDLPAFVAGLFNWRPWWLYALFRVRAVFVRLLGMRQPPPDSTRILNPVDVPFESGKPLGFFTVYRAEPDRYHICSIKDKHLIAYLGVIAEAPVPGIATRKFRVVTIVKYLHWTGPLYFNIIRPFHHLVVWRMAQSAAR